ncbi:MAG: hypothetical protein AAF840_09205 [Bacteroidota bacterium]
MSGLLFLLLLSFVACTNTSVPPPSIGFYHWQQRFHTDSLNNCLLAATGSSHLYVKVMDVGWQNGQATPLSKLDFRANTIPANLIPVTFMTNEILRQITSDDLPELARNLVTATEDILGLQVSNESWLFGLHRSKPTTEQPSRQKQLLPPTSPAAVTEWQLDCDWTASTKAKYFYLLTEIRQHLPAQVQLSVTVRLHQFINQKRQGVPPADRGVLMAYNVGELDRIETENSILDTNITVNYLRPNVNYPLPLDIALPYYQWGVIYRDEQLAYLSNDLTANELSDSTRFERLPPQRYQVKRSTYLRGYYLYAGDHIRLETITEASLRVLARQLRIVPRFAGQRMLYYHLGSRIAKQCDGALLRELSSSYAGSLE